jgi:hypothetical protein
MQIIHDLSATGAFGDMWSNLHYAIDLFCSSEQIIATSHISRDNKKRVLEMYSVLRENKKPIIWEDTRPTVGRGYITSNYKKPYHPTKIVWSERQVKNIICLQLVSPRPRDLPNKNLTHDEDRFIKKFIMRYTGIYQFIFLDKSRTLHEIVSYLAQSALFVGICSGMSHLCHSVGTPMLLKNWSVYKPEWYGSYRTDDALRFFHPHKSYHEFRDTASLSEQISNLLYLDSKDI